MTPDEPDKKDVDPAQDPNLSLRAREAIRRAREKAEQNPPQPVYTPQPSISVDLEHQSRMAALLKTFSPEDGRYVKTMDKGAFNGLTFSYNAATAQASGIPILMERGDFPSSRNATPPEEKALLEKGGEILARVWPLFGLLHKLEDKSKAEALRRKVMDKVPGGYEITLSPGEFAHLQSALAQGRRL